MPTTYLSINEFAGDGVTTQFEFAFAGGYIDRTHVKARITAALGIITPIEVLDAMFVTDNTLDLGVSGAVGSVVRIYRETPRDEPLVDFTDRSRLTAANLDLLARQTVLSVAEAFDNGAYLQLDALLADLSAAVSTAASSSAAAEVSEAAAAVSAAVAATFDPANFVPKAGGAFTGHVEAVAGASGAQIGRVAEVAPAGMVATFARAAAPAGWLAADGAVVSRSVYAGLFSAVGTLFGAGDGSTTFQLPDLRGEFVRGLDASRGVDAGRTLGSAQVDQFKNHYHPQPQGRDGSPANPGQYINNWTSSGGSATSSAYDNTSITGGTETRPRNIALLMCIKT